MKHLTMGTAGHVDHGKTSLIKLLTGFDCDTHKEEKNRGITIHLGFSHIKIDEDKEVGIIDVPGHKDFINTMIAGASSIDFVMLVISADSGIMPQTQEHLKIMELLDIKSGFVALTKTDLVDEELTELAIEEVKEFVSSSFLENCNIIKVSSKTGNGLNDIRKEIANQISMVNEKDLGLVFRMYIDRIFSVTGHGTVVNGSVLSGKLVKTDEVLLLPDRKNLRIRGIERFKHSVDSIFPGDRASLNVTGLKVSEFRRGMLITSHDRDNSDRIDCHLVNYSKETLKLWSTVILLSGTYKSKAKMHLIDKNELTENETAIVQITLDKAGVFYYNDKYIIRDSSNTKTIGGGRIIDAYPLKHKKRPKKLIDKLHQLANNEVKWVILNELEKSLDLLKATTICRYLNITLEVLDSAIKEIPDMITIIKEDNESLLVLRERKEIIEEEVNKVLRRHHLQNKLSNKGLSINDIFKYISSKHTTITKSVLISILKGMTEENSVKAFDSTYLLSSHNPEDANYLINTEKSILEDINQIGVDYPEEDLKDLSIKKYSLKGQDYNSIINHLIEQKLIIPQNNVFISASIILSIIEAIKDKCPKNFKVSEVRDALGVNRKITLYYLEIFDKIAITKRMEDTRVFTGKEIDLRG